MARKLLIAVVILGVLLGVASIVISLQPDSFSVERSLTMAAPPATLFAQVNDLQAWDAWSPWKELDPNAKVTLSSPSAGRGATITWTGNEKIGQGHMTILESLPDELVEIEQVFIKPLAGTARMSFRLTPEGDGTRVTWKMAGTNNFIAKAICLFMDMDATIGKELDRGLANMKTVAEAASPATAATGP